jgi:hypothetical protein
MSDREESSAAGTPAGTPEPSAVDWTDDGIFRAAYLSLYDCEDREVLRRAGVILACQAISGDTPDDPVLDPLRAVAEDLQMAGRHLREIAEKRQWSKLPDPEHDLCRQAEQWAGEVAALRLNIVGALGAEVEPLEPTGEADRLRLLTEGVRDLLDAVRDLPPEAAAGLVGQLEGHLCDALAEWEGES